MNFITGTYCGTVDAAGRSHGCCDWEMTTSVLVACGTAIFGQPYGSGVFHRAGTEGGSLERVFEDSSLGEGVLLLATGKIWPVRMGKPVSLWNPSVFNGS